MPEPLRHRRSNPFRRRWRKMKDWWRSSSESKRDVIRIVGGLALVGLVAGGLWYTGRPAWRGWRQKQALAQVETYAERNDYRNALLALRRATEADPNDPRVWREAVAFLSKIGSPEALVARQNLARLDPGDMGLRIALVTEALRFGDLSAAKSGVGVLEQAGRNDTAFHRLAAAVALALGRTEEFEGHLVDLIAADPGDAAARYNLAALRLWSVDEAVSAAAAADLAKLGTEPALRVRVTLERLKFVAATRDPARVDAEVAALLPLFHPDPAVRPPASDEPGEPPGWGLLMDGLKTASAANPRDVALLARWLGDLEQGPRALGWIEGLPEPVRTASEVMTAATDLAARGNDLERLRGYLRSGAWGTVSPETVDLALAARVQRLRFGEKRARTTWEDAVATSMDSLAGLHALARLGGIWRDRDGVDRALQAIVDRYPREYWACEALRVSYAGQRDMDKLWRLYQTWAPRALDNKPVQQTWVMLGALLNRGETGQLARAEALLAEEGDAPETATLLAVAAARWRAGRLGEAEEALGRLSPAAREEPRALLWAAVFAADANETEALGEVLERLPRESLMREEQLVLSNALAANERRRRIAEREASARAAAEAAALAEAANAEAEGARSTGMGVPMVDEDEPAEAGPAPMPMPVPVPEAEGGAPAPAPTTEDAPAEAAAGPSEAEAKEMPAPVVVFP